MGFMDRNDGQVPGSTIENPHMLTQSTRLGTTLRAEDATRSAAQGIHEYA